MLATQTHTVSTVNKSCISSRFFDLNQCMAACRSAMMKCNDEMQEKLVNLKPINNGRP